MKPIFIFLEIMSDIKSINLEYTKYNSFEELPQKFKVLYNEAKLACDNAYAPYSKFKVGAAVLLDNEEIIKGSNQENAAYPSGLCAERTALFFIGSNYKEKKIEAIAVAATKDNLKNFIENISPCGGCRQVMSEYEDNQKQQIEFLMPATNGSFLIHKTVKNFLPFEFNSEILNS